MLPDVLRTVRVGVRHQPTLLTDVQPAFDALAVRLCSTGRAGLRRVPFGDGFDGDTAYLRLVREHRREAVERPSVEVEVSVTAPILRAVVAVTDATEVANKHCPDAAFGTLLHNLFRERVEEVGSTVGALPVETARFAGERVVALRALFGEVVFVLLERATGIRSVG